ncbi:P-loop containing nucleoside triphosphate hydrolase protein [Apiosordaria backusii]|uniref:ATP-dependent RNA helicase n=1 Tax=Apiosordaria backusii TaxID=314023 RepID=A0AA40BKY4_9PEZI|nr:P-loop containing nucleoside triphosphate hydrolase protein [Apiosordaria backusii]
MADDGMLLNFEIDDAPLVSQVKFKGGRWRDRVKANKSAKAASQGGPEPSAKPRAPYDPNRPAKRPRANEDGDDHRPAKAPRTNDIPWVPTHAMKTGLVSSSLFTSIPNVVTKFGEEESAEPAEPAKPSNAPLSEEAENFHTLGLSKRVAHHLATKLEMKAPTSIQKNTIPQLIRDDSDAFLQAETGSGKTLAYLLPIVHRIMELSMNEDGTPKKDAKVHRNSGLFAIILAPTRELCKQIAVVLEKVLRCAPWLVCTTVIGGESKHSEKARIRKGVNILVATPGRLTDHLDNTKVLDVGTVRWLVLDEGDRMMEMGFEDDIKTIVGKIRADKLATKNSEGLVLDGVLPKRRVTVLCSATMKMNVQKLGEISLEDAVHITASKSEMEKDAVENSGSMESAFTAPAQLKQSCIIVPAKLRLVTLIALLKATFARKGSVMKAIIFISCADSVDFHYEILKDTAFIESPPPPPPPPPTDEAPAKKPDIHTETTVAPAAYITSPANNKVVLHKLHGSLAQPVRSATLKAFSECKDPAVLITTDISSRGLDVPAVDLVIEYDPAFAVPDHVHRIGRTARAGRAGKAVLFLLPGSEEGYTTILPSSSTITPQLYESILQNGLASNVNLPASSETANAETESNKRETWTTRAEALQLHFEQRLLAPPPGSEDFEEAQSKGHKGKFSKTGGKSHKQPVKKDNPLLDAARQAFRSHIRAYATHVREERVYFDMMQLHLGHMAKAFGLREAPGGIGSGISRRTHKFTPATNGQKGAASASSGVKSSSGSRSKFDDDEFGQVDEDAARRMKAKMKMLSMNSASEFNLG